MKATMFLKLKSFVIQRKIKIAPRDDLLENYLSIDLLSKQIPNPEHHLSVFGEVSIIDQSGEKKCTKYLGDFVFGSTSTTYLILRDDLMDEENKLI